MAVVVLDVLVDHGSEVATAEDETQSKHLRRMVPTKRSAKAFARGARIRVRLVRMPPEVTTSSKLIVNLVS